MLTRILEWSLRHRLAVVIFWAGIVVAGVLAAARLPLDAFPDTTPVQVQINTVAPALGPLEIERQLMVPIEWTIFGLPDLAEVRSVAKYGFGQVTVTFADGTNIHTARQSVMERLAEFEPPAGIERPHLGPVSTGLGEVFHYLLTSSDSSLAEVRGIQDWLVKPQLRSVPGVAEINSWGGDERQIQVVVDPASLQRFALSLEDIAGALADNNVNVGGGVLEQAGEASIVQGVGLATSPADIARMVVATRDGVPILLRDVARIVEGREPRRGAVTADGRGEAVLGLGFMLMGENSNEVSQRLRLRLDEVRKTLPGAVKLETVYERTELVDRVLRTVKTNLAEGAILVVAVLFAFLGNLRAGLIVASAIPLSMLFASNLMLRFGIAGSLMSLGAIDFGLLVDSAVIQIENVMRRVSESGGQGERGELVRDAVLEVRKPTLYGELIIAIVYLPLLTLEGIEGKLFRPMALTVLFALMGSLLLSLTLIPALASLGIGRTVHRENALVRWLKRGYQRVLRGTLDRPRLVLGSACVVFAAAVVLALQLGAEFVPRLQEGSLVINTVRLAGVSVDESVRYGTQIERALLEKYPDEVARVWTRTGSAEVATDPMGVELSDIFIMLKAREEWRRAETQDELVEHMAAELSVLPGMKMVFTQPIEMRMNEMIAGIRADLGIRLFGDDFAVLKAKGRELEEVIKAVPGAADVFVEQLTGQSMLQVDVDREAIARHGIPVRDVLGTVEALGGRPAGLMYEGRRVVPIRLRLDDRYRLDGRELGRIPVAAANGDLLPLDRLARISTSEGPSTVQREWGKRRLVIQANVRGRDLGGFVAEARAAIAARVALPPGYYIRYGGQFEHLERARLRLMIVVPAALALIYLLLLATFGRWFDAARVFTGVPFAAVGGIVALWLRGMPFTISAGVGFVVLSGVSVLAVMVLVTAIRQRLAAGDGLRDAIEGASLTRLRPVLMTALVASLGFLPMALNTGFGAEVQRPLATVVVGGVLTSTLLTLVVLPTLFYWSEGLGLRRKSGRGDGVADNSPG